MSRGENLLIRSVKKYCTALRFLTVIPVSFGSSEDQSNFHSSVPFFPVVGMTIGLLAVVLSFTLLLILPQQVVAFIMIVFLAFICNCLHLDGAADTADGLLSSRSREKSLAIMKDSRVGAMGASLLIFLVLGKFAALITIPKENLPLTLFFMPFAGRVALLITMATASYARAEGGLGELFYSDASKKYGLFWGVAFVAILFLCFGFAGLGVSLAVFATLFALNWRCKVQLGGVTGDVLGAQCELAELMIAISFSAMW